MPSKFKSRRTLRLALKFTKPRSRNGRRVTDKPYWQPSIKLVDLVNIPTLAGSLKSIDSPCEVKINPFNLVVPHSEHSYESCSVSLLDCCLYTADASVSPTDCKPFKRQLSPFQCWPIAKVCLDKLFTCSRCNFACSNKADLSNHEENYHAETIKLSHDSRGCRQIHRSPRQPARAIKCQTRKGTRSDNLLVDNEKLHPDDTQDSLIHDRQEQVFELRVDVVAIDTFEAATNSVVDSSDGKLPASHIDKELSDPPDKSLEKITICLGNEVNETLTDHHNAIIFRSIPTNTEQVKLETEWQVSCQESSPSKSQPPVDRVDPNASPNSTNTQTPCGFTAVDTQSSQIDHSHVANALTRESVVNDGLPASSQTSSHSTGLITDGPLLISDDPTSNAGPSNVNDNELSNEQSTLTIKDGGQELLKCKECDYVHEKHYFDAHVRHHELDAPHKCVKCTYSASDASTLLNHTAFQHQSDVDKCSQS